MSDKRKKAVAAAKRYKKEDMKCNKPQKAPPGDKHKKVVKSCHHGEEKIIRYGARGYEVDLNVEAKRNFAVRASNFYVYWR